MNNQPQVPLARPEWHHEDYFSNKFKDVTVLICQRKTRDLIQLCLTSILNHYPEINILVVDGHSEDDSVEWLRFMAAKHSNVKLWERPEGRNSHGETMHEAMQMIETKYVLFMDSDTIVRRGGFVEGILFEFEKIKLHEIDENAPKKHLYAIGSLMLQSIKGEACSQPIDESDVLRYAHPSCSMYDVEVYKTLQPFTDHGAPCALNNIDAQSKGYAIEYFPIDKYVQHLCGASWQEVPTVWNDDGDVQVRPLVTFICGGSLHSIHTLENVVGNFNIINSGEYSERKVSTYDRGELHFHNYEFDIRFKVNGYYVVDIWADIHKDFLYKILKHTTEHPTIPEFQIDGIMIYERKHWQKYYSTK